MVEQFLNPAVNDRTDQYGADTLENRLRFVLEVTDAIIARIGSGRTGVRISPYGQLFDMPLYPEAEETYKALCAALGEREIAYVHVMDQTNFFFSADDSLAADEAIRKLLKNCREGLKSTALILAGDLTLGRAQEYISSGLIDLAGFGQPFISNPDLVARLKNGWPLAEPDRDTYYGGGAKGYIDYPPFIKA